MRSTLNLLILLLAFQLSYGYGDFKVKLKDVQALTFYRGRYTVGRKPMPQLNCQAGHGLCKFQPDVVQCTDVGFDGIDQQWKCTADLDKSVKFNRLSVNCEGYDYPDDPYIIAGSCALEYSLAHKDHYQSRSIDESSSSLPFWIFVGFIGVFVFLMFCKSSDESSRESQGYNYRGFPTAPPPAGFRAEYHMPPPKYESTTNQQSSGPTSSGPGFFSGLGLGALGGYLFSNRSSSSYTTSPPLYTDYNYYRPSNTNTYYQDDLNTSSNETYSAEGFCGTKRR